MIVNPFLTGENKREWYISPEFEDREESADMEAIKMVGTSVIEEIESAVAYFYRKEGYTMETVQNLVALAAMESGLDPYYKHPTSSAEGLFAITADVQHKYGGNETMIIHNQVATALRYIQDRYKNTDNALNYRVEKGFW